MQQAQGVRREWHTLVADEAQAVKNPAAKRSLALFELPAAFRMALSGTPIENRLAELWSIMRFCNPGLLGTLARFNERFATPIERDHDRDAQRMLRRLIAPFVLRRTKAEVLQELPPRTELSLTIAPEAAEPRTTRHCAADDRAAESAVTGEQTARRISMSWRSSRGCAARLATRGWSNPSSGISAPRSAPSANWRRNLPPTATRRWCSASSWIS